VTSVDASAMGRAITLGEYLCRRQFAYELVFAPEAEGIDVAARVRELSARLAPIGLVEVAVSGLAGIRVPHSLTDGIGAWAALRTASRHEPVTLVSGRVDVPDDRGRGPKPTRLGRCPNVARPFPHARSGSPTSSCFYRLSLPTTSQVTARVVGAIHAAVDAFPHMRDRTSAVAVSVTACPWTADGRPVANLSSATLSVLAPGPRRDPRTIAAATRAELEKAREHRAWLVRSTGRFGRLPRFAWPCLRALGAGQGVRETAVVSNLGRLPGIPLLADLTTFLTVPVRSRGSVSFGIIGVDGTSTATATAQADPDEVDRIVAEVWRRGDIEADRVA
jgi:hypothetical protein